MRSRSEERGPVHLDPGLALELPSPPTANLPNLDREVLTDNHNRSTTATSEVRQRIVLEQQHWTSSRGLQVKNTFLDPKEEDGVADGNAIGSEEEDPDAIGEEAWISKQKSWLQNLRCHKCGQDWVTFGCGHRRCVSDSCLEPYQQAYKMFDDEGFYTHCSGCRGDGKCWKCLHKAAQEKFDVRFCRTFSKTKRWLTCYKKGAKCYKTCHLHEE